MKSMTEVSVIIPHLNYGRFLPQCLDSIITQTLQPYEIILVDGGSTDETFEVLKRYPTVKVVREPFRSGHIPHAINLGLLEATGEFWHICNSDCWLERTFYEKTLSHLTDDNVAFAYTNWNYVDETGGAIALERAFPFDRERLKQGNFIDLMSGVFRKGNFFDETLAYHYDWLMWVRLSRNGKAVFVDEPLVNFRVHGRQRARDPEYLIDFKLAQIKIQKEETKPQQRTVVPTSPVFRLSLYRRVRRATGILLKGM